ncbi:hypothetical protein SAMN04488120_10557 [Fontimonas thermophila]|uniref:SMODS-associated and fused to various effectors domain-containing protein n=1 Tax=Fontimonas thermophila TaxID=1076937 RepID=A0A1I2IYY6_9GAMM|nr:hypothetical protein [Fontimonas thermophila]SFF47504.1 hypothetical protein SAMN04488120_10557 [Fontimonas thermophila]
MSVESWWTLVDRIGIVVGLVVAVPIFWTWWQVTFGIQRRRRRWLREISQTPGARPGVLIIDQLAGRDVRVAVERYLASNPALAAIPSDRRQVVKRDSMLMPEHTADFARDLRSAVRRLQDAGVDVIHCFHAGPDVSAMIAGAELSNGPRVLLYHFEQGSYQNFGPLEPLRMN